MAACGTLLLWLLTMGVAVQATCKGEPSYVCRALTNITACRAAAGCVWDADAMWCSGAPLACAAHDKDEDACEQADGCTWQDSLEAGEMAAIFVGCLVLFIVVVSLVNFAVCYLRHRRRGTDPSFDRLHPDGIAAGGAPPATAAYVPPTFDRPVATAVL